MSEDQGKTVGTGLGSPESIVRVAESIARDLESIREMGVVNPAVTFADISDSLVDAISSRTGMSVAAATDVAGLIGQAVERLETGENFTV